MGSILFFDFYSLFIDMKMLISNTELDSKRSRDIIALECLHCGNTHYRTKNVVLRILNGNLKNTLKGCFCSIKCKGEYRQIKKINCICKQCGKTIERASSKIRGNVFCDASCAAIYNNSHKKIIHNTCVNCNLLFKPKRSNRNSKYCSSICRHEYRNKKYTELIESGNYTPTNPGNYILKRYLIKTRGYCCELCNLNKWMEKDINLTIHHRDGNASNNIPTNLQLLCWNCHSMTDTYGSKNPKSARKFRYI